MMTDGCDIWGCAKFDERDDDFNCPPESVSIELSESSLFCVGQGRNSEDVIRLQFFPLCVYMFLFSTASGVLLLAIFQRCNGVRFFSRWIPKFRELLWSVLHLVLDNKYIPEYKNFNKKVMGVNEYFTRHFPSQQKYEILLKDDLHKLIERSNSAVDFAYSLRNTDENEEIEVQTNMVPLLSLTEELNLAISKCKNIWKKDENADILINLKICKDSLNKEVDHLKYHIEKCLNGYSLCSIRNNLVRASALGMGTGLTECLKTHQKKVNTERQNAKERLDELILRVKEAQERGTTLVCLKSDLQLQICKMQQKGWTDLSDEAELLVSLMNEAETQMLNNSYMKGVENAANILCNVENIGTSMYQMTIRTSGNIHLLSSNADSNESPQNSLMCQTPALLSNTLLTTYDEAQRHAAFTTLPNTLATLVLRLGELEQELEKRQNDEWNAARKEALKEINNHIKEEKFDRFMEEQRKIEYDKLSHSINYREGKVANQRKREQSEMDKKFINAWSWALLAISVSVASVALQTRSIFSVIQRMIFSKCGNTTKFYGLTYVLSANVTCGVSVVFRVLVGIIFAYSIIRFLPIWMRPFVSMCVLSLSLLGRLLPIGEAAPSLWLLIPSLIFRAITQVVLFRDTRSWKVVPKSVLEAILYFLLLLLAVWCGLRAGCERNDSECAINILSVVIEQLSEIWASI